MCRRRAGNVAPVSNVDVWYARSRYSLLQSNRTVYEVVNTAAERGIERLALCDYGTVAGIPSFAHACRRRGIVPIAGCELPVRQRRAGKTKRFGLLATNGTGWTNLVALSSTSYDAGSRFPSPIPTSMLRAHSEGLFIFPTEFSNGNELERVAANHLTPTERMFEDEININLHLRTDNGDRRDSRVADTQVREAARDGLRERLPAATAEHEARLEHELRVFQRGRWSEYLLMLAEVPRFCRERGIRYFGAGGAAAGSLVLYCLGVSEVEPIGAGLLFERLYNRLLDEPLRSFPIIVEARGRQEIFEHFVAIYGTERAVSVAAYVPLQSKRRVVRMARVGGETPDRRFYSRWRENPSTIAIAHRDCCETMPLYRKPNRKQRVLQYSADELSRAGFFRIDILEKEEVSAVEHSGGFTVGDSVPRARSGLQQDWRRSSVQMPGVEDILGESGGELVYQEQFIRVLHRYTGWSLERADLVRRTMAKKDARAIDRIREDFAGASQGSGYVGSERMAREVFEVLLERVSGLVLKAGVVGADCQASDVYTRA